MKCDHNIASDLEKELDIVPKISTDINAQSIPTIANDTNSCGECKAPATRSNIVNV